MKKIENIRVFENRPDYIFADDENTAILWPEKAEAADGSIADTIRVIEHHEGDAETVELRIWGYDMPADADEYNELLRDADAAEIERV